MLQRLVLASGNAGKVAELRALLAPLDWEIIPQGELGVGAAEEPHATFLENALAKARHVLRVVTASAAFKKHDRQRRAMSSGRAQAHRRPSGTAWANPSFERICTQLEG